MSESSNQPPLSRSIKTLFTDNPSPQGQQTRHNGLTYLRQIAARVHHCSVFAFFNRSPPFSKIYLGLLHLGYTHLEKNDEERFEIEIVQGFFGRRTNLQEEKVPI